MWEFNGLPLHPLIVHAAVVFGPLAALSAIALRRAGARAATSCAGSRSPLVAIAFLSIWAAYFSGDNYFESDRFEGVRGELKDKIEHHEELAGVLRWITTGFFVVTVIAVWQHARQGAARYALSGAASWSRAVLTLVWVAMTGDAGSQAVYG